MSCAGGCGPGCCGDDDAPIQVGTGAPRLVGSMKPGFSGARFASGFVEATMLSMTQATGRITPLSLMPGFVRLFEGGGVGVGGAFEGVLSPVTSGTQDYDLLIRAKRRFQMRKEGRARPRTVLGDSGGGSGFVVAESGDGGGWYYVESGGGIGVKNTCFWPHDAGQCDECPSNLCVCHNGSSLASQSKWQFFLEKEPPKAKGTPVIKSRIVVLALLYDDQGKQVGQVDIVNPPEYWVVVGKKAVKPDCHSVPPVLFDRCKRCRMELKVWCTLSLCMAEMPDNQSPDNPPPPFFQGPGGWSKHHGTGFGEATPYPKTKSRYMQDFTTPFNPGTISEVAGFGGGFEYETDPDHCAMCPTHTSRPDNPRDNPPKDGGGTPTDPPKAGGGTSTPRDWSMPEPKVGPVAY